MNYIQQLGQNAARAKKQIAGCPTGEKNRILTEIAAILRANASEILKANEQDIAQAKDNGISDTMIDRLRLTMERIDGIADACLKLTDLEDPVGEVIEGSTRPNGMKITKIRVPMGVIGIIFESRPNVTVDAAALCIKSGNAAILRGGKEAFHSNCKLMELMREAVAKCGYDKDMIQLVEDTSREVSTQMMRANDSIDVLIPRGGAGLIQAVVQNATVPVIETGTGNCHIYVDETADLAMAVQITDNGKTQRPSVCNALETCLVHEAVAEQFLPMLQQKLEEHQVEIRGCERTRQILGDSVIPAPRDFVGEAPLTAPESVAVYELTKENDFLLILAYHTQGEVIYWKYLDYEPARSKEIADYFASVSGYAVEETPSASGYAGYKDWFIEEYDRPGYTVEAGMGENPLPMTQVERIYHDNKGILVGGMTQLR